jgi:glycosyltransferase involved in cell wall biosynthesis
MVLVIIPTIGAAGSITGDLIETLLGEPDVDEVRIYDNSDTHSGIDALDGYKRKGVHFIWQPGETIYKAWNEGMQLADERDCLILNDDVRIAPGTVAHMRAVLDFTQSAVAGIDPTIGHPVVPPTTRAQQVRGSFRHGGITGNAFMTRLGPQWREVQVHPDFIWWFGDDSLFFSAERSGLRLVRCVGLGVEHIGGASSAAHPVVLESVERDRELLRALWGPDST